MGVGQNVLSFGKQHLDVVLILDGLAGGSGFYGHPITRELGDGFAFGEKRLKELSEVYEDPLLVEIREKVEEGDEEKKEEILQKRKNVAEMFDTTNYVNRLFETAKKIENNYMKKVRMNQAKSLQIINEVLLHDLDIKKSPMKYDEAVASITGIKPALIPSPKFMQDLKEKTLVAMGYPKDASLGQAAAEWRKKIGLLSKNGMGDYYKKCSKLMLKIIKDHGVPKEAKLDVEVLEKAPWMGFFAYGNKKGDLYGKTCMVKSDTKCIFDIIQTAAHEVGGHYYNDVRWHKYAKDTEDLYGGVCVMATSRSVVSEGFANCSAEIYHDDLKYLFENVGFDFKMDMGDIYKNLKVSANLELIAMASLGYEVARLFYWKNVDAVEMKDDFIEFGCDAHRAGSRAEKLCSSDKLLQAYCYTGPGYYPGMKVFSDFLEKHSPNDVRDILCGKNGPCSIATVKAAI